MFSQRSLHGELVRIEADTMEKWAVTDHFARTVSLNSFTFKPFKISHTGLEITAVPVTPEVTARFQLLLNESIFSIKRCRKLEASLVKKCTSCFCASPAVVEYTSDPESLSWMEEVAVLLNDPTHPRSLVQLHAQLLHIERTLENICSTEKLKKTQQGPAKNSAQRTDVITAAVAEVKDTQPRPENGGEALMLFPPAGLLPNVAESLPTHAEPSGPSSVATAMSCPDNDQASSGIAAPKIPMKAVLSPTSATELFEGVPPKNSPRPNRKYASSSPVPRPVSHSMVPPDAPVPEPDGGKNDFPMLPNTVHTLPSKSPEPRRSDAKGTKNYVSSQFAVPPETHVPLPDGGLNDIPQAGSIVKETPPLENNISVAPIGVGHDESSLASIASGSFQMGNDQSQKNDSLHQIPDEELLKREDTSLVGGLLGAPPPALHRDATSEELFATVKPAKKPQHRVDTRTETLNITESLPAAPVEAGIPDEAALQREDSSMVGGILGPPEDARRPTASPTELFSGVTAAHIPAKSSKEPKTTTIEASPTSPCVEKTPALQVQDVKPPSPKQLRNVPLRRFKGFPAQLNLEAAHVTDLTEDRCSLHVLEPASAVTSFFEMRSVLLQAIRETKKRASTASTAGGDEPIRCIVCCDEQDLMEVSTFLKDQFLPPDAVMTIRNSIIDPLANIFSVFTKTGGAGGTAAGGRHLEIAVVLSNVAFTIPQNFVDLVVVTKIPKDADHLQQVLLRAGGWERKGHATVIHRGSSADDLSLEKTKSLMKSCGWL